MKICPFFLLFLAHLSIVSCDNAFAQQGSRLTDVATDQQYRMEQKENFKTLIESEFYKPQVQQALWAVLEISRGLENFRQQRADGSLPAFLPPSDLQQRFGITTLLIRDESDYLRHKVTIVNQEIASRGKHVLFDVALSSLAAKAATGFQGTAADIIKEFVKDLGKQQLKGEFFPTRDNPAIRAKDLTRVANYLYDKVLAEGDPSYPYILQIFGESLGIDLTETSKHPLIAVKAEISRADNKLQEWTRHAEARFNSIDRVLKRIHELQYTQSPAEPATSPTEEEIRKRSLAQRDWFQQQTILLKRERDEANSFFQGAAALARLSGMKQEDVQAIERISQIALQIDRIREARLNDMPISEASAYLLAVEVTLSFFKPTNVVDPNEALGRMLLTIAERLDDMRREMHSRFHSIESSLERYFEEQFSLLKILQQSQTIVLAGVGRLSDEISAARQDMRSYVKALANRQIDEIRAGCGTGAARASLDNCLSLALSLSAKWSRDTISLPSGPNVKFAVGTEQPSVHLAERLSNLERVKAYWGAKEGAERAQVHITGLRLPNQAVWLAGVNFLFDLIASHPESFGMIDERSLEILWQDGEAIQKFYRSAVADSAGSLDVFLLGNLLRAYEKAIETATDKIEALTALSTVPLNTLDQRLPEERISEEEKKCGSTHRRFLAMRMMKGYLVQHIERQRDAGAAHTVGVDAFHSEFGTGLEDCSRLNEIIQSFPIAFGIRASYFARLKSVYSNGFLGPVPIDTVYRRLEELERDARSWMLPQNTFDLAPHRSEPGRGTHLGANSSLQSNKLTYCDGHTFDLAQLPVQAFANDGGAWMRDRLSMKRDTFFSADVLSLIPRPVLWAERLNPRSKLSACIMKTKANYWSGGVRVPGRFRFEVALLIRIDLTMPIEGTYAQFHVADLSTSFSIEYPHNGPFNVPVFDGTWGGDLFGTVKVGPIKGNESRVFEAVTNSDEASLRSLRGILSVQAQEQKRQMMEVAKQSEARGYIKSAEEILDAAKTLLFIGLDRENEISEQIYDSLHSKVRLLRPDDLYELMIYNGMTAAEVRDHVSKQIARILSSWRLLARQGSVSRPTTPVDIALDNLRFVQSQIQK